MRSTGQLVCDSLSPSLRVCARSQPQMPICTATYTHPSTSTFFVCLFQDSANFEVDLKKMCLARMAVFSHSSSPHTARHSHHYTHENKRKPMKNDTQYLPSLTHLCKHTNKQGRRKNRDANTAEQESRRRKKSWK